MGRRCCEATLATPIVLRWPSTPSTFSVGLAAPLEIPYNGQGGNQADNKCGGGIGRTLHIIRGGLMGLNIGKYMKIYENIGKYSKYKKNIGKYMKIYINYYLLFIIWELLMVDY